MQEKRGKKEREGETKGKLVSILRITPDFW
jgi:hypothetical protein